MNEEKLIKRLIIGAVVAVLVVMLLIISVFTVKTGEVAIISRFGKVERVCNPGLNFKIPFIESKMIMTTKERTVKFGNYAGADEGPICVSTSDMQTITLEVAVANVIEKPLELYEAYTGNHLTSMMIPRIKDAVQSHIAKYTIEEFVSERDALAKAIFDDLFEQFAEYGIRVTNVAITDHDFSDEYDAAIESKKVAEQKAAEEAIRMEMLLKAKEKEVEIAEKELELKKLEAEANAVIAKNLTQEILMQHYIEQFFAKWDGKLPLVMSDNSILPVDLFEDASRR